MSDEVTPASSKCFSQLLIGFGCRSSLCIPKPGAVLESDGSAVDPYQNLADYATSVQSYRRRLFQHFQLPSFKRKKAADDSNLVLLALKSEHNYGMYRQLNTSLAELRRLRPKERFRRYAPAELSLLDQVRQTHEADVVIAMTGTLAEALPVWFLRHGCVLIQIGKYIGRNRTAFSDWSSWSYMQHLHLLYYDIFDDDMTSASPAEYQPWFADFHGRITSGDIKTWLDPQRLAALVARGIELADTRELAVHNGEPEHSRFSERHN